MTLHTRTSYSGIRLFRALPQNLTETKISKSSKNICPNFQKIATILTNSTFILCCKRRLDSLAKIHKIIYISKVSLTNMMNSHKMASKRILFHLILFNDNREHCANREKTIVEFRRYFINKYKEKKFFCHKDTIYRAIPKM